jgi:ABC-type proline/glycine betaine transport system substrate-binding protein
MAYMNQERKAQRAPVIKAILKKYGIKGTLSVRNHSTLVLNVKSGKIDFIENYIKTDAATPYGKKMAQDQIDYVRKTKSLDVNPYWFHEHFSGKAKSFLTEAFAALKGEDFFDETDAQVDYFHCSHYVDVNIGQWDRPYEVTA